MGDYLNCVVKHVSSNCGDDAARYKHSVLVHFMKPSLDLIDCDVSGEFDKCLTNLNLLYHLDNQSYKQNRRQRATTSNIFTKLRNV